ncbi:MAG TPA: tRNA preQ1(34) S-adenosylmethionine ribosyltransferase-isomerase QueA, partial [Candidatus Aerophobetes bacterium]|nr:tRNA preQ1(34) S-adenosylmethionine ribosyltransferase-isomerase QueA [Candidatus Aerophobetes bacterium]
MKVKDFDYFLPKEAIAQTPWPKRDECRLLVLEKNGMIHHRIFRDILDYLRPGDTLVINVTKVIPARVIGRKEKTGGKVEIFLLKKINGEKWECILRP